MDGRELLRRYARGQRDFRGIVLRQATLCEANLAGRTLRTPTCPIAGFAGPIFRAAASIGRS